MGKNIYDIKRGHYKNIEDDKLEKLMEDTFGSVESKGDRLVAEYGAIKHLEVWTEGKTGLWVDIEMDEDPDDKVATDTISKWNGFLLNATGFDAKQRGKRAKKKAKETQ